MQDLIITYKIDGYGSKSYKIQEKNPELTLKKFMEIMSTKYDINIKINGTLNKLSIKNRIVNLIKPINKSVELTYDKKNNSIFIDVIDNK